MCVLYVCVRARVCACACVCVCTCVCYSLSSVRLFETPWTQPARLLCAWNSLGKNTGVGCHSRDIYTSRLLYPLICRWTIRCFRVLATVNSAAMKTGVRVSFRSWFCADINPGAGLLGRCCCCAASKSCPTLCDPVDCSTPDFPLLHYLPEFA